MTVTTRPGPRTPLWAELQAHASRLAAVPVRELFERDPRRYERFSREQAGLLMDFSRQRLDEIALAKLLQLADAVGLRARIDAMWRGEHINATEDRAVLHVALRQPPGAGDRRRGHRAHGHDRARAHAGVRRRCARRRHPRQRAASHSASWSTSASAARTWVRPWRCRRCGPTPRARRAASSYPTSTAAISPRCWRQPTRPRRCSSSHPRPSPRSRP